MQPSTPPPVQPPYQQGSLQPNPYAQFAPPAGVPIELPKERRPLGLIVAVILLSIATLGLLGFSAWAFTSRQDYKNNVDAKIADAVAVAREDQSKAKDAEFTEKEKNPYKTYAGPATYGSVSVVYPKTWSAYVNEAAGSTPLDGYFHPNVVPGATSGTDFALRMNVVNQQYATELKRFDGLVKQGKVRVSAYKAPKVPSVTGVRIDGEISTGQNGSMVLLPIRDKTIKISTESASFAGDFDKIILANLAFQP